MLVNLFCLYGPSRGLSEPFKPTPQLVLAAKSIDGLRRLAVYGPRKGYLLDLTPRTKKMRSYAVWITTHPLWLRTVMLRSYDSSRQTPHSIKIFFLGDVDTSFSCLDFTLIEHMTRRQTKPYPMHKHFTSSPFINLYPYVSRNRVLFSIRRFVDPN